MRTSAHTSRSRTLSRLWIAVIVAACMLIPTAGFAFTLNVVDGNNQPVSGFRWLVEEDTTHPVTPGAHVTDSLAVSIHKTSAPIVASGTDADLTPLASLDPGKRYAVSVLPDSGYALGAANVAIGQAVVTVIVQQHPIPTAQISVLVFHDIRPINDTPDIGEQGLANFTVLVFDQLGQMSMDAFGNPLGTTYNPDGSVLAMGSGVIKTDANGVAHIKNLAPGKYGVRVVPDPAHQNWSLDSTIEGTPGVDAWVKANEPRFLREFGANSYHAFYGFVEPNLSALGTLPNPGGNVGSITGRVVSAHQSRPPLLTIWNGNPVPECWIGLNTLEGGTLTGVYTASCNADSTFSISNVPPGTYQLVMWDKPLDYIFAFRTVIIPSAGGAVNLGDIAINRWFGAYEGTVFNDVNQNGFRDPGEVGITDQVLNLRYRDGSIYQSTTSQPPNGEYQFSEVFPLFKFYIAEVDFTRYKATGATVWVDNGGQLAPGAAFNPQPQPDNGGLPYRTELGPVLLEAMTVYADQTNKIDWGKTNYAVGENGGITGITYYATTRAEDDPRYSAMEPWEPGIARVQVNLYQDADADGVIDDLNGDTQVTPADVDNYPFGWQTGGLKGPEDVDWNANGVFDAGDAVEIAHSDTWDDNLPTGCVGPQQAVYGTPIIDCAETMRTWNQVRPAVFDGGYAFGSPAGGALASGTYIVEVAPPPGYEFQKEEDKNVVFGDTYTPGTLMLPAACVGDLHVVPQYLSLFPGALEPTVHGGETRPFCNRKQVIVQDGRNAAADFPLFTYVPKSARAVGLITNDLAIMDPMAPVTTEKLTPAWIPISFQDYTGKEIERVYSDEWGAYNALVPSTYTINPPIPTGVSPNMVTVCLNHPGPIPDPNNPGLFITDPNFSLNFGMACYTLDFWPGKTTYLDTPVIPLAAFAIASHNSGLDCESSDLTPEIYSVVGPGGVGPHGNTGDTITITSVGLKTVANPDYDPLNPLSPITIQRDFGFGTATGTVTVGGVPLSNVAWSDLAITGTIPGGMSTGELIVTRADNNRSTPVGVTLTVGAASVVNVAWPQSIQAAIDTAAPGSLILVGPGVYNENLVLWKRVKLQGAGANSTFINAFTQPSQVQLWHTKVDQLIAGNLVSTVPGQDLTFPTEEGAGIMVLPRNDGTFGSAFPNNARIDGLTIMSAQGGGGIIVNGYAHDLQISNNRIFNNQGAFAGGIRVGTPGLVHASCGAAYCDSDNDDVVIHHNQVLENGQGGGAIGAGGIGAGGIGIYNGTNNYQVYNNAVCGNFTTQAGAGIAHIGLSSPGLIAYNTIAFNEASFGAALGEAGGIYVSGEAALAPATLSPGAGNVVIDANLIQGNLAGGGFGGGILASSVNGLDVAAAPTTSSAWYQLMIANNMIVNNSAGFAGGGIALRDVARASIINNTVSHNDSTATTAGAFGGALQTSTPEGAGIVSSMHSGGLQAAFDVTTAQTFSNPVLANNIVWQNRSFYYDGTLNGGLGGLAPNATAPYWDLQVFGGTVETLNPTNSVLTSTAGYDPSNVMGDPRFVMPYFNLMTAAASPGEGGNFVFITYKPLAVSSGDYHIQSGSSAIDNGNAAILASYAGLSTDFDNEARPNGGVDIGADERYGGALTQYTITAIATFGGTIVPSGAVTVNAGNNGSFTVTPDLGYHILTVAVDGVPQTIADPTVPFTYNFINVQANHSIRASFAQNAPTGSFTITASASAGGTITPLGVVVIANGADAVFTITPNAGYHIGTVTVDNGPITVLDMFNPMQYTFTNVSADHTIDVTFVLNSAVLAVAPGAFDYGAVKTGGSMVKSFIVTNSGTSALTISSVSLTGANASEFSRTETCTAASIAAGGSCTITVTFAPVTIGSKAATLEIASNAPGSPTTAALTGTGVAGKVTVLSPNGGETVPTGSTQTIQWWADLDSVSFNLYYSTNNGSTWKLINTAGKVTGTSYPWTVPAFTANMTACRIKVVGYNALNTVAGTDTSNAAFTIQVLALTNPVAGASLTSGTPVDITWLHNATIRPVAKVKLTYNLGGLIWKTITTIAPDPGTNGTYAWTVPTVATAKTKSRVRVTLLDAAGKSVGSITSGYFTIHP